MAIATPTKHRGVAGMASMSAILGAVLVQGGTVSKMERYGVEPSRWTPKTDLGRAVFRSLPFLPPDLQAELLAHIQRTITIESELRLGVIRGGEDILALSGLDRIRELERRALEDLGVVSRKVITDNGVARLASAFLNTYEPEVFNYHGIGTNSTAEAAGDSILGAELTTAYNPDNTRATGTQSNPSANLYRSIGTNAVDAGVTITEHGLFSQAATGAASSANTLFDRSVFTGVALASGDSLQSTYTLTITSGG